MSNPTNTISITLEYEKTTQNCVKFTEKPETEFAPVLLGSIYVHKSTLADMEYPGGDLTVKIVCGDDGEGILLDMEKPTQNTILFREILEADYLPAQIGKMYVPKSTLKKIGFTGGKISVTLECAVDMDAE